MTSPASGPSTAPVVSILVISYNTREMTLACLASVEAETRTPHEVIVVDNASEDQSAEAIQAAFPRMCVVASDRNHGFAMGNNIAADQASGEYLLLLNPDTVVLDGAIDRLVDFARLHPEAGIWGGVTFFGDGTLNPSNAFARMTIWSLMSQGLGLTALFRGSPVFNPEAYPGWDRTTPRSVDIVSGCFFLISRKLWTELGGLDASFVMYGEEADLCLRAARLGWRPAITPTARIIHYGGASERVRADKFVRLLRAKVSLVDRHLRPLQRPIGRGLLQLWPASRMLAHRLLRRHDSAAVWGEVWHRRAEWRDGYPTAREPSPAGLIAAGPRRSP